MEGDAPLWGLTGLAALHLLSYASGLGGKCASYRQKRFSTISDVSYSQKFEN
jgi:hypothetical protein